MATPLGFLMSSILCEEGVGDLREVVERVRWREWNHSDVVPFRLEGKVRHITGSE